MFRKSKAVFECLDPGSSRRPSGSWHLLNVSIDVNDSVLVVEGPRYVEDSDVRVQTSKICNDMGRTGDSL